MKEGLKKCPEDVKLSDEFRTKNAFVMGRDRLGHILVLAGQSATENGGDRYSFFGV